MSDSKTLQPIESLRPGRFTAMGGQVVEFSPDDLASLADGYDPELSRAPIVVGHPKHDDPAFGWIDAMRWDPQRQRLDAVPGDVDPAFAEQVRARRYRHVSLSVYLPNSPANPKPGVYYPRHLGFLGAQPPAVKGLREASLAESEEGVIELSAPVDLGGWEDTMVAGMLRRLREWMIGKFGKAAADEVLPAYELDALQEEAVRERMESKENTDATFAESKIPVKTVTPENDMTEKTAELAERQAELDRQQQDLQTRQDEISAREAELAKREHADFAESLIRQGKLLPRDKDGLVEFMAALPKDATLEFGEGEARQKTTNADWFHRFLQGLPKQVEFGEVGGGSGDEAGVASFAAPGGYAIDAGRLDLHNRALAYQQQHQCGYEDAVKAVAK
jgi:hypothetical protein